MAMAAATAPAAMLRGVGAVSTTSDPQVMALLEGDFTRFDQWKSGRELNGKSRLMRLRLTLDHLLTRLLGARDFAGAAQILSVLYHRFTLLPARCVQASLEILRRHPQHHKEELMQFYQTALRNGRLDQVMVFKEMLMLHIVSGDYYEAYHLFKDDMQELDVHHDPHLQGTFGMVCYWLLFIESDELRSKYSQEHADSIASDDEDGVNGEWNPFARPTPSQRSRLRSAMAASSAAELLESRYRYKTAIGAHILYQEASTALRRAIAVSPESAVFLEFYVQLLTLTGDTGRACDLLEHFYYLNPSDPHAARLLASYLEAHFPESSEARVDIYVRWMQSDPSSTEALSKLVELFHLGLVSRERLLTVLANSLDEIGGDLHLAQSPETVVRLWRLFCEAVQRCTHEENTGETVTANAARAALDTVRSSRRWWIRSYMSRPATAAQVIAYVSRNEAVHELVVLKAVVAYHLFGEDGLVIGRAIQALLANNPSALRSADVETFRRIFPMDLAIRLFVPVAPKVVTQSALPHPSVSVLSRSLLVKDTTHASRSTVDVTRIELDGAVVDQELVRALEEAVRIEQADGQHSHRPGKRSFETMISGLVSASGENRVSVPLYVDLIEELLYKRTEVWAPHIQVQLNGYLRDVGGTIPTWLEVEEAFAYFQQRWNVNEVHFDHPGLLLRYEVFLVRYLRKRAKASRYWVAGVSPTDVHNALQEMKLHVSRSHVHFPGYEEAAMWMRIRASRVLRTRRRLLRDYMLAMRFVSYEHDHTETRDLVYAAMRVAAQNFHSDLLAVEDLQRQAMIVLLNRYAFVVRTMRPTYREFFEAYVRVGRAYKAEEVLAALKRRYIRMKGITLADVKAFLWLKRWEATNPGRYHELVEDHDDDDQSPE